MIRDVSHQGFTVIAISVAITTIVLINTMLIRDVFRQDFTVTTIINHHVDQGCVSSGFQLQP